MNPSTARLLISCPDQRGIVAAVANFIAQYDGNILDADQHTDRDHAEFFMRVEIDAEGFLLNAANFAGAWQPLADKFRMRWYVHWAHDTRRMAILVSRMSHCLNDLLWRWKHGELRVELVAVISNHPDLRETVESFGVPYEHLPVTSATKDDQERAVRALLERTGADFVVLARYMQILSPTFVADYRNRLINIHHSFLPAFAGARPYHQAHERGVKIIGATSHYVTDVLDDGPIIAQQTLPVDHRDGVDDLVRKGRDLERLVLAEAVRLHVEDRILVARNKTVVFQ